MPVPRVHKYWLWFFALAKFSWTLPLIGQAPYTQRPANNDAGTWYEEQQIQGLAPLRFDIQEDQFLDSSLSKPWPQAHLQWGHGQKLITVLPQMGIEERLTDAPHDLSKSSDLGVLMRGQSDRISFWMDFRTFSEDHSNPNFVSYDREWLQTQGGNSAEGLVHYTSYNRVRGALELDGGDWGAMGWRRDAFQWGAASFYNLTFSSNAIPFNQVYYHNQLGPLRVMSLWGQLMIPADRPNPALTDPWFADSTRAIFAHRYEWQVLDNLTLAANETMILFQHEDPFAFVPVLPLTAERYFESNTQANSNLSFDFTYRWPMHALFYGEFYIDDMQSPLALFNNYWSNKWAAMLGSNWTVPMGDGYWNAIAEWCHIEPWVYTFFTANTAQTDNYGYPLGNQLGPNSMGIKTSLKYNHAMDWNGGLTAEWVWKGTDRGSNIEDPSQYPQEPTTKTYLAGVNSPNWSISPSFGYRWSWLWIEGQLQMRDGPWSGYARLMLQY